MNQILSWFGMTSNMTAISVLNGISASIFNHINKTILVFESLSLTSRGILIES